MNSGEIKSLVKKSENAAVEFKRARGGVPADFWPSYSAFANTDGRMLEQLRKVFLEGTDVTVESFIRSRPSASEPYLILAALECLRLHVPMNEAEILGRCRRIRYAERAAS